MPLKKSHPVYNLVICIKLISICAIHILSCLLFLLLPPFEHNSLGLLRVLTPPKANKHLILPGSKHLRIQALWIRLIQLILLCVEEDVEVEVVVSSSVLLTLSENPDEISMNWSADTYAKEAFGKYGLTISSYVS